MQESRFLFSVEGFNKKDIYHHGIKGQKWGIRRFQNPDGTLTPEGKQRYGAHNLQKKGDSTYLKKGSVVRRVSLNKDDPTYNNRKYVSISPEDHDKWEDYMGEGYKDMGRATYNQTYESTKDLKVATKVEQGKIFAQMKADNPDFYKQAMKDAEDYNRRMNQAETKDEAELISRNLSLCTASGEQFVNKLKDLKYDAIFDTHGTNVSKNPLIILDPDKNLKKIDDPSYTKATQKYYDDYYKNMFGNIFNV